MRSAEAPTTGIRGLPSLRARFPILILIVTLMLVTSQASSVSGANGESYALSKSPGRIQESNANGVTLSLTVTNATTFTAYAFTWTVTDPSGTVTTATNNTNSFFSTSFTLSVAYPKSFSGATTKYVGNYTAEVDETSPANKLSVAQAWFLVGLTDSSTYQRTSKVSIQAIGFRAGEAVTVNILYGSSSITGFPVSGTADNNGVLSYLWQSSPGASTGTYSVSLRGSTTNKNPADIQLFTMYPTNITITQIGVTYNSLQRTETERFQIAATYLSGVPVTSGTGQLVIIPPGSSNTQAVTAYSNSSLSAFAASYRVPLSGPVGTWAARVDPYSFNDGYGNGGPLVGSIKGFDVQSASLSVSVILLNKTYTMGDLIVIGAVITNPDGSHYTSGNVTAYLSLSGSGASLGNPISLSYVQTQDRWVGSTIVGQDGPTGVWLVHVKVSDVYGNTGDGSTFAAVTVPPVQSIPLYYFIALAAVLGSGGATALFLRRFNTTDEPFEELYKLTGGQFPFPSTLMIRGESGSGTTTLALQLIYAQLKAGRACCILAYDAFPLEIQQRMEGMGWDVASYVKDGSLKFLDCYSALLGSGGPIRDAVDFTEVSIQFTLMMDPARGPMTILLDSFTPIFDSPKANQAVTFLRVLGAKVKSDGGLFIMTGTKGSLPVETESRLESVVDGLIDLKLVKKGDSLVRLLTVKKFAGRQISPTETQFEISQGNGITFKKPRIRISALWRTQS